MSEIISKQYSRVYIRKRKVDFFYKVKIKEFFKRKNEMERIEMI